MPEIQKPQERKPERIAAAQAVLVAFLEAWRDKRWEAMAASATLTWRSKRPHPAEELAHRYNPLLPTSWKAEDITGTLVTLVVYDARVICRMAVLGEDTLSQIAVRLVCERGPYNPHDTGKWGVAVDSIQPRRHY